MNNPGGINETCGKFSCVFAFFGMMTNYSENVLGIFYRRKNSAGEWSGGAMYYLRDGLGAIKGCKALGAAFVAVSVMLFAFSTCLGWSHYGSKACEFLLGEKITKNYVDRKLRGQNVEPMLSNFEDIQKRGRGGGQSGRQVSPDAGIPS